MTEKKAQAKKLEWKWVWITLGMFAVFYILPLIGATAVRGEFADKIIGGWSFGGIIVITAVSAMLSKGETIWEPAIAGAVMTVLWYVGFQIVSAARGLPVKLEFIQLLVVLVAIFGLSLLGAGLGEGIQNLSRDKKRITGNETAPPVETDRDVP